SGLLMMFETLLAMVISRPSRTHATPSAMTMRVWNFDQSRRSSRAGTRLRFGCVSDVGRSVIVVDMAHVLVPGAARQQQPQLRGQPHSCAQSCPAEIMFNRRGSAPALTPRRAAVPRAAVRAGKRPIARA